MSAILAPTSGYRGTIEGLPIDVYHAAEGISKTGLDAIARSPATFFAKYLDANRPPERDRAGQLEGSLAHCALLEPEAFDARYAMRLYDGRTKEGREEARFFADKGLTLITRAQRTVAMLQAASMRSLPCVAEALAGEFVTEQSAFAGDRETGCLLRCRPDLVYRTSRGVILFDVKTYSDASPREFARQVARKRYHTQCAFYRDVYGAAAGVDVLAFIFVAVETEYPFLSHAMMLDDESEEVGRRLYRRDLETFAECLSRDSWPGYGDEISTITLPAWALKEAA